MPHLAAWTGSAGVATPGQGASLRRGCVAPDRGSCAGAGPATQARRPQAPAAASLRARPPAGSAASAAGCPHRAGGKWRPGRGPPASGAGAGAGAGLWRTRCWHRCRHRVTTAWHSCRAQSSWPDRRRRVAQAGGRRSLGSSVSAAGCQLSQNEPEQQSCLGSQRTCFRTPSPIPPRRPPPRAAHKQKLHQCMHAVQP